VDTLTFPHVLVLLLHSALIPEAESHKLLKNFNESTFALGPYGVRFGHTTDVAIPETLFQKMQQPNASNFELASLIIFKDIDLPPNQGRKNVEIYNPRTNSSGAEITTFFEVRTLVDWLATHWQPFLRPLQFPLDIEIRKTEITFVAIAQKDECQSLQLLENVRKAGAEYLAHETEQRLVVASYSLSFTWIDGQLYSQWLSNFGIYEECWEEGAAGGCIFAINWQNRWHCPTEYTSTQAQVRHYIHRVVSGQSPRLSSITPRRSKQSVADWIHWARELLEIPHFDYAWGTHSLPIGLGLGLCVSLFALFAHRRLNPAPTNPRPSRNPSNCKETANRPSKKKEVKKE
jgi:hypothetical protein